MPRASLQLLPGDGAIGAALTAQPDIAGVAFTGSDEDSRDGDDARDSDAF
ncbi:MAG: hypothetical protein AAFU70_03050 [Planctomycetota bacterium]